MNEIEYNAPLLPMQKYMLDYLLNRPKSTMHNLYYLFKWSLAVDEKLLAAAVARATQAHPVFNTMFYFFEDGEWWQKKLEDEPAELTVEYISEAELETIKATLVQPFLLTGERMYRCRVFKTEAAVYLFLDIHHSIVDGFSYLIFMKDINKAYRGQNLVAETYTFYHAVWDELDNRKEYENFDAQQYYDTLLQGWNGKALPVLDAVDENFLLGDNYSLLELTVPELCHKLRQFSIDESLYFMTVMVLTNMMYNKTSDIVFTWIHNGRTSRKHAKLVGLMIHEHLMRVQVNEKMTVEALFDLIKKAKDQSMEDLAYPFYEYISFDSKNEMPTFLFQGNIKAKFEVAGELYNPVELPNPHRATGSSWDVELCVENEEYALLLEYCSGFYKAESVARWAEMFRVISKHLIDADTVEDITVMCTDTFTS